MRFIRESEREKTREEKSLEAEKSKTPKHGYSKRNPVTMREDRETKKNARYYFIDRPEYPNGKLFKLSWLRRNFVSEERERGQRKW